MPTIRTIIALTVTFVWALLYIASIFDPSLSTLIGSATPVMLVVVGWMFAAEVRRKNGNGTNGTK